MSSDTSDSIPSAAPEHGIPMYKINVGLIYHKPKRRLGDGAYSPGLEYDADVYCKELNGNVAARIKGFDIQCTHIPAWDTERGWEEAALDKLDT